MTTPNTPNRNNPSDRSNAEEMAKHRQQGDLGRQAAGAGGHDRSNEARTSFSSGSSSSSPSSQDRSSQDRSSQDNDRSAQGGSRGGNDQAIECLASALEVVIREMPRGTSAKLDSAQEHLRKAREQLSSGGDRSAASGSASRSGEGSSASRSGRTETGRGGEQDRYASGRDDESRKAPGRENESN